MVVKIFIYIKIAIYNCIQNLKKNANYVIFDKQRILKLNLKISF